MSTSSTTKIRIREAEPADINAVTEIMLAAMPEDRDWWDYRFPYRDQYPDDHKRFLRLLVETWVSAEFADWIVLVAEALDDDDEDGEASGAWQMGAYAVWDAAYVGYRKHGPGYSPPSVSDVLLAADSASRRDVEPSQAAAYAAAADEAHRRLLDVRYGAEAQLHLQALGTHPSLARRGLARALCRWGQDRAARDGVAATLLAAPMARRSLYPRLGFVELGVVTAQVPGKEAQTSLWPMVWEPEGTEDKPLVDGCGSAGM